MIGTGENLAAMAAESLSGWTQHDGVAIASECSDGILQCLTLLRTAVVSIYHDCTSS